MAARRASRLAVVLALAAASAHSQTPPAELRASAEKSSVTGSIPAWCRAEFRVGHPGAFAVAIASPGGGRHAALDADRRAIDPAAFKGKPDLQAIS